jgi:small subunit ribosomal protein S4e
MTKRHLKRLAAPKSWKIERKTHTWAARPRPSGHKLEDSIPLLHIIRDVLKYADNYREAKRIIKEGKVVLDGKVVKDPKRSVGLMDIIEIPLTKERYLVTVDKAGTLTLESIKATEAKAKLLKIVNKRVVKGGMVQLNFHDGRNMIVDAKKAQSYNVHDSIIMRLKDKAIKQHVKYGDGALAFVTKGSHRGDVATIKERKKTRSPMANIITLEKDGKAFRTVEDYLVVIGKDKPLLSVMK